MSWPLRKLSEVATLVRGVTFSKAEGADSPEVGRIPVIRAGSIQNTLLVNHGQIWVPEEKVKKHQLIRKNDILMCTSSGSSDLVGKCAKSDADYDISFGAFCAGVRPDINKVSPSYLYHFLSSPKFKNWTRNSSGANIKNIRVSELAEFEIPLPPLEEQKRIAAILDKADAIRHKRKQAIDLADEFLRSVFLDMFGKYLGAPNNLVSFGDVTKLDAKMVDPTLAEYTDLLHIGPDRIVKRTGEILPALTAREEGLKSKKFLFSEQYVIYSKIRPYLRKAAIPDFVALCSADMYPIKPVESKVTKEFIWALLLSDFFDNYVCTLPDRASIPKLNKKELAAFQFSLPPYEEIQKFSDIAKKTLKNKNTQQVHQLDSKNLFKSLSQKAFSGQL